MGITDVGLSNLGINTNPRFSLLVKVLTKYTNLRSFTLRPSCTTWTNFDSATLSSILPRSKDLQALALWLQNLEFSFAIPPPTYRELRHLTLINPGAKTLIGLPDALKQLERPLLSLCLEVCRAQLWLLKEVTLRVFLSSRGIAAPWLQDFLHLFHQHYNLWITWQ